MNNIVVARQRSFWRQAMLICFLLSGLVSYQSSSFVEGIGCTNAVYFCTYSITWRVMTPEDCRAAKNAKSEAEVVSGVGELAGHQQLHMHSTWLSCMSFHSSSGLVVRASPLEAAASAL